ncbi:phytanoyl-CoA dioxygenase family protein [Fodinicola feengrottensis]|uniref:phytanoyl-CoA dioxygenase family protein n=1 Tax=Fodinicola feengrottensis TaxID=435914 RepID=UPI0024414D17|nr:phytanoyl-CoA dioxygenase family protein [Fodinicola feengrottensis]
MSVSSASLFRRDGYVVARGLFDAAETERLREHYMTVRHQSPRKHEEAGVGSDTRDPLRRYPRLGQMHRWDQTSLRWLLDERIRDWLVDLLGAEPYAVQSMLYFKPPGSRGQALHQDNFYLKVEPGTCMAAWLALDRTDTENGCMMVVPGGQS